MVSVQAVAGDAVTVVVGHLAGGQGLCGEVAHGAVGLADHLLDVLGIGGQDLGVVAEVILEHALAGLALHGLLDITLGGEVRNRARVGFETFLVAGLGLSQRSTPGKHVLQGLAAHDGGEDGGAVCVAGGDHRVNRELALPERGETLDDNGVVDEDLESLASFAAVPELGVLTVVKIEFHSSVLLTFKRSRERSRGRRERRVLQREPRQTGRLP